MLIQEVNTYALQQAAEAVVGPQATAAVGQLYTIIDRAMKAGYDLGKADAAQNVEEALDEAFDNGWDYGHAEGVAETQSEVDDAGDEGYVAGVREARARPELADEIVRAIISEQAADEAEAEVYADFDWDPYFDPSEYSADLVQDSGDETDADEAAIDEYHPDYCDICCGRCEANQ